MARRDLWFGLIACIGWLLPAGCLSREDGPRRIWIRQFDEPAQTSQSIPAPDAVPAPGNPLPAPPVPPPDLSSDYKPRAVSPASQTSMSLDPGLARPRVEVKPASHSEPPRPDAPLVAALRCALEKHPDEARKLLDKYDKADRELLLALLQLTAGVGQRELERFGPDEVAAAERHLGALLTRFRSKAPLALENVCFCRSIEGFGRFERVSSRREFQVGCDGRPGERVQVYAEVRNFRSRLVGDQYETILESKLEIRDAERKKVVSLDLGRSADRSYSPRQDYFLNFQLHVPPKLPPGLYTLWVTVRDVTGEAQAGKGRQASCSLDFKACPPGASAQGDVAQ